MIITRETDYAIRILRSLCDGERHSISEITEQQMIPKQFAYKILQKLSHGQLVEATRGVGGGCRLAGDLSAVTLYDLIGIIDAKSNALISCMDQDFVCQYRTAYGGCDVHRKLTEIENRLAQELQHYTLADILQ